MIEGIGSRSSRWMKIKREEFVYLEETHRGSKQMPRCIERQESRLHHAISSLSSSSESLNNSTSSGDDSAAATRKNKKPRVSDAINDNSSHRPCLPVEGTMMGPSLNDSSTATKQPDAESSLGAHKVSSSSGSGTGSGSGSGCDSVNKNDASNDFHDYHAKPMPDPKLYYSEPSGSSPSEDSPGEESNPIPDGGKNNGGGNLRISNDSSSGDDDCNDPRRSHKRRKPQHGCDTKLSHHNVIATNVNQNCTSDVSSTNSAARIAKKGGIPHNIRPAEPVANGIARIQHVAPAIVLPPFAGIGKRSVASGTPNLTSKLIASLKAGDDSTSSESIGPSITGRKAPANQGPVNVTRHSSKSKDVKSGPVVIVADNESSSADSVRSKHPAIKAHYHINEDDMILMDEVVMCPYIFRSQGAVACGALAECAMPGMLRAHFSGRNKLLSLELVYDAMGFMQQLERASGNEGTAQIIPGSLEMALAPCNDEARAITLAQPPYYIVNVNEVWTKTTGYTQMEVEGKDYYSLLEGEGTVLAAKERQGRPPHRLDEVAKGRPACSTNIHYDKDGRDFIEFVCSYPLTTANGDITHLLHVSKELPSFLHYYQQQNKAEAVVTNVTTTNSLSLVETEMMMQQSQPQPIQLMQENM